MVKKAARKAPETAARQPMQQQQQQQQPVQQLRTAPNVPLPAVAGPPSFHDQVRVPPQQQLRNQAAYAPAVPPPPSFTDAPAPEAALFGCGSPPVNIPKAFATNYKPQTPPDLSAFSEQECRWLTPEALKYYEPLVQPYTQDATVFIPWPMYYSQDPKQFCPARFPGDETEFDEWAFQVPFVKRTGSDFARAVSFIPYSDEQASIRDFVTSPYQMLRHNLIRIQKDRPFRKDSPWFRLTNRWTHPKNNQGQGELMPKVQLFRLVVCILLAGTESIFVKTAADKGKRQSVYKNYYDPKLGMYGKGAKAGERLVCFAVSEQVWRDYARCMNAATRNNEYAFPDPVDPTAPAVFYSWAHKLGQCPIPGQESTSMFDGSSGIISSSYYFQRQLISSAVSIPPQYYCLETNDKERNIYPSNEYYAKTIHIGQAIRRLSDLEMACLLAEAFQDARDVFELGWKGTSFETLLGEAEFQAKFRNIQQVFNWSESVFEGAPVSVQVQQPQYAQQPQQGYPQYAQQGYPQQQPMNQQLASVELYLQRQQQQQQVPPAAQYPQQPQRTQGGVQTQQTYTSADYGQPTPYEQQQQVVPVPAAVHEQQHPVNPPAAYSPPPSVQSWAEQPVPSSPSQPDECVWVDDDGYQVTAAGQPVLDVYGRRIFVGEADEPEVIPGVNAPGGNTAAYAPPSVDVLDNWQQAVG